MQHWEELPPLFMTSAEGRTGREELLRYIDTVHQSISPSMYVKDKEAFWEGGEQAPTE